MGSGRTEIRLRMRMITETATTQMVTRLRYCVAEPFAVTLVFDNHGADRIEWVFGRDLLAAGLTAASGDGDVRVWPAEGSDPIFFELRSPSGRAVFAAGKIPLQRFLAHTEKLVPRGGERAVMAMDYHLATLLGGESGLSSPFEAS